MSVDRMIEAVRQQAWVESNGFPDLDLLDDHRTFGNLLRAGLEAAEHELAYSASSLGGNYAATFAADGSHKPRCLGCHADAILDRMADESSSDSRSSETKEANDG